MAVRLVKAEELKIHNTAADCWIAIHGRVYNVTRFLRDHPGGGEVISSLAGSDVSSEFEDVGHSDTSRLDAKKYFIGVLEGAEFNGEENIPLLAQLRKQTIPGIDTRLVLLTGVIAVTAAVASFYILSSKK